MENWLYDKTTMNLVSGHYRTSESLPDELFQQVCKGRLRSALLGKPGLAAHPERNHDTLSCIMLQKPGCGPSPWATVVLGMTLRVICRGRCGSRLSPCHRVVFLDEKLNPTLSLSTQVYKMDTGDMLLRVTL